MIVELEEVKAYLRVDDTVDDTLISGLMESAECICQGILRAQDISAFEGKEKEQIKTAVLYATAYFYEHREEADHHSLLMTLRSLLIGIRDESF